MGSRPDFTRVLSLDGYYVTAFEIAEEKVHGRLTLHIERRGRKTFACGGCGRRTARVRDTTTRRWDDLPWAGHPVTLVYEQRRVRCKRCGIRAELVPFADLKARVTRRLRQQIGLDCQSMPTSHAAIRHSVSWGKARRAEKGFLLAWDAARPKRRSRYLGADETQRGKGQHYWTVLSDLVHSEVIGLARDRDQAALTSLLTNSLDAHQRGAVQAMCTDMHQPYLAAIRETLPKAAVVFDKFHVLQHAADALDEVRRHELFRAGAELRELGRGKRWLMLRRWRNVRGNKRTDLTRLLLANKRLCKAYIMRDQLDQLWTYKTHWGVQRFLDGWNNALRWQRLPEMEKLGTFLVKHVDGIKAYCDHPVRFGVVESLNTTIKAVLRRARGIRDEAMLLLKIKWATAHPVKTSADLKRFLDEVH
jgi:transposase